MPEIVGIETQSATIPVSDSNECGYEEVKSTQSGYQKVARGICAPSYCELNLAHLNYLIDK
jgi:hypothetical protein